MSDWNRFKRTWLLNDGNCDAVEEKQARWATRHCWIVYGDVTWVLLFPVLKARYSEVSVNLPHTLHTQSLSNNTSSHHTVFTVDMLRYVVSDSVAQCEFLSSARLYTRHCSGPGPPGSCSGLFPLQIDILTLLLLVGYFLMRPLC